MASIRLVLGWTLWMLISWTPSLAVGQTGDVARTVTIGIVQDGSAPDPEDIQLLMRRNLIQKELIDSTRALLRGRIDVRFPEDKIAVGDWTVPGIRRAIRSLLDDPEVDLVVSLAPIATHELAKMSDTLSKPVIGVWALDIEAQGLPFERNASGVAHLNYLVSPGSIVRDLQTFAKVTPMDRLHILVDRRFLEAIPEIPESVIQAGAFLGIEIETVSVDDDADEVLRALPEDTEAVYVTPLLRMRQGEASRLIEGIHERRIPTFSLIGEIDVRNGVLAGMRTEADLTQLARRIAIHIQRILEGEDAGTLPVVLDQPERLTINMRTARAIGAYPSWRTLIEARQIHPEALDTGPPLDIREVVEQALDANRSLLASRRAVNASREDVARARSALAPRLEATAGAVRIDEDRAAASFGSQAETTTSGTLAVTQLLFSEDARARIAATRSILDSEQRSFEVDRLDLTLRAATAYLDVLRAETLERVERDNLRLTESNLDLARRRERIGISGPADVYRWESALASQRSSLIAASNRVSEAKVALNRLRHRPLEEPFTTIAVGLDEPWLITFHDRLRPYADNPVRFQWLREFYVGQALANSVELRSLDAVIAARKRTLLAAKRRNRIPSLVLRGEYERVFDRSGEGSEAPALAPGSPLTGLIVPLDDDNWSVALVLDVPLFEGGGRLAEVRQAREELEGLRLEREALVESIETSVRAAMFRTATTFTSIELAREAADAAGKNLDLVTDAYSRGAVSIIDLLDAQNASLSAEAAAANAVFDFLLDLMEVQRASNSFDFFLSDEQREGFLRRLHEFYEQGGVAPRR